MAKNFLISLVTVLSVSILMNSFSINQNPSISGRIFLSVLTVFMLMRIFFYFAYRKKLPAKNSDPDRWFRRSISIAIILPVLTMFGDFYGNFEVSWFFSATGCLAGVISVWLIWQAHSDLAGSWSPGLKSHGSGLVTTGVYSYIRHPIYTAFMMLAFSQLFLTGNIFSAPALLMFFVPFYLKRVKKEESDLAEIYGEEYLKYRKRTSPIFPSIRRKK